MNKEECALAQVFTDEVLSGLRRRQCPSKHLSKRVEVLDACGPYPNDQEEADRLAYLIGTKAAWDAYLSAALHCGFFEGNGGKELLSRLRGRDDDNFRASMAECLVCWYFAAVLKLPVTPKPDGRGNRCLEMQVQFPTETVSVEVKAPSREYVGGFNGDDSDLLSKAFSQAAKQFDNTTSNLLVLVPSLRRPLFSARDWLIRPFYGEFVISILFDPIAGRAVGEPENKFVQNGKWLNPVKLGRLPANTRISGVLSIEERFRTRSGHSGVQQYIADHDVLVLHNPHAKFPLPTHTWRGAPQFLPKDDYMMWDDGYI